MGRRLLVSIVGARPQFVKAAVIADAIARLPRAQRPRHLLVHTGQHYDREMSAVFFQELPLPTPAYRLGIGGLPTAALLGRMTERLAEVLTETAPDAVIVYGDTTSTLAGALAAATLHRPVAHVEAGLRSFNREMPEETNRVLTDRLSSWLFCPSRVAAAHLRREGIRRGVHIVGDVMTDALHRARAALDAHQAAILGRWGVAAGSYYLATLHRTENTRAVRQVLGVLNVLNRADHAALVPLHPRTRRLLEQAGWRAPSSGSLRLMPPVPYHDMLALERGARAVLTDSGGVQKEAYYWGVPCLTLRGETEWVETLAHGWNRLIGLEPRRIKAALASLNGGRSAPRPRLYGDGRAGERIVRRLIRDLAA